MPAEIETITCKFIGDFKVGDNILAGAAALCRLRDENEDGVFNKLIVVQAGSILEAALDQIIYRAQEYVREGVPNIPTDDLEKIRSTRIERFNNIIQAIRGYNLLNGLDENICDELDRLRQLRNRIHIQFDDKPEDLGRDDSDAFTSHTVDWALGLCIKILVYLSEQYPRPANLAAFAHDISIPKP